MEFPVFRIYSHAKSSINVSSLSVGTVWCDRGIEGSKFSHKQMDTRKNQTYYNLSISCNSITQVGNWQLDR
jgi:hypothetical protein